MLSAVKQPLLQLLTMWELLRTVCRRIMSVVWRHNSTACESLAGSVALLLTGLDDNKGPLLVDLLHAQQHHVHPCA
jgi:hypothetical protein